MKFLRVQHNKNTFNTCPVTLQEEVLISVQSIVSVTKGRSPNTTVIQTTDSRCWTVNHYYEDIVSRILEFNDVEVIGC